MAETADRTESLFAAAVALAPEERGAFLERECAGDPALREQVLALLRAHDRAGHVIDRPINGDRDQTAGYVSTSEHPGTIIAGRYKLLEEIGQGGMGTVWAAEQTAPVRRKVALKLIKAGMDSRSVLARFEAERQALALMDHPNIAKVLDGGITDSGRPYFVMEYVKGVPITEYCDATRLSVEERLNLFVQVCSALQHAHQKGIIHRDLKPSNILVAPYDDKPVPKVIDFGLAKAMHQSLTEKTLYTAHETVLGTPLYMSPEQAQLNNLDVDTRADIYSLGVLLYELLTGTTPLERQRFKEAAWDEIRRIIREEEPPRPSLRLSSTYTLPSLATFRHTEPAKLKKLVRGELDWIVMKALEKDRTRRYETANGLARDIQRYLDDEVVEARPPSAGYRFGKFVRRHKAQMIGVGLVLLALLAGIAGTTWGLVREARARTRLAQSLVREQKANTDLSAANDKVQARYDLAVDAIKTFHTGVSEDFLLKEEKFKDLRNRLLKSASDFYGKLSALLGKETDFASRRELARSNYELAELTGKVGAAKAALAAHQAVLAMREALAAESGKDIATKVDVGRSMSAVAYSLNTIGKTEDALATYRRAESLLAGLARSDFAAQAALADCRCAMAVPLGYAGQFTRALEAIRLARADRELLAGVPGATNDACHELAETIDQLGWILWISGKPAEGAVELRTALVVHQKLADDEPGNAAYRLGLAGCHFYLGSMLAATGRPAEGELQFRESIEIQQKLVDENPAVSRLRRSLGLYRNYFCDTLLNMGKPVEAEAECRKAIALLQKVVDEEPTVPDYRGVLAHSHESLGIMLLQHGEQSEAEAQCHKALVLFEKLVGDDHSSSIRSWQLASTLNCSGDVARTAGKTAEAKGFYDRAIALQELRMQKDQTGDWHRFGLVGSLRRRGLCLRQLGDLAGATADTRRAVKLSDVQQPFSGYLLFETACCHAVLAGLAGRAGSGVSAAEGEEAANRAMEWLQRAVANGYRNSNQLRIESALDSLRNRPDFKKLMAELENNAPPQRGMK
jgi:tetratricopeptide (TPR) repeat protein